MDELLVRFGITHLNEVQKRELNRVWHRLDPWPDARRGLALLKRRHVIATLSNGNVALLVNKWPYRLDQAYVTESSATPADHSGLTAVPAPAPPCATTMSRARWCMR